LRSMLRTNLLRCHICRYVGLLRLVDGILRGIDTFLRGVPEIGDSHTTEMGHQLRTINRIVTGTMPEP